MKLVLPIDLERVPKWAKVTIGILVAVLVLIIMIKANEDEVRQKQFWQQCCQLCWFSLRKWQFENPKDWQLGRVGDTDNFPVERKRPPFDILKTSWRPHLCNCWFIDRWQIISCLRNCFETMMDVFLTLLNIMVFLVTVKKEPSVIFLIRSMTFSRSNHHENVI